MSAFSLQRILPVLLASAFVYGSVCAGEGADKLSAAEVEKLDSLRFSYHLAREEITQKQWVEPMEKLRKGYRERMNQLQLELAKTGALEKALAARAAEKTEPTNKTIDSKVPEVAAVQKIFLNAQRDMLLRVDKSFSELARSQLKKLFTIKSRLTKANRLDSALVVDQAIKKITPDAKALPASPKKPRPQVTANPASDFEWITIDGGVTIRKLTFGLHQMNPVEVEEELRLIVGKEQRVVIPRTIESKPVTCIGDDAFVYHPDTGNFPLTRITIPDSVTSISKGAFRGCEGLERIAVDAGNVNYTDINGVLFHKEQRQLLTYPRGKTAANYTIPDGVSSIGFEAFFGCYNLTSITIPDSVTSIGYRAFYKCSGLTSITIGDGVTSIRSIDFNGCHSLTAVTFLGNAPQEGEYVFFGTSPTIYRKPDAKGWGNYFAGRPVKLLSEKP